MTHIAVVGVGIAGLNAALTLQDAGLSCTIYEASHRVGGRMRSDALTWADGMVSEWCGEFIDAEHETIDPGSSGLLVDYTSGHRGAAFAPPTAYSTTDDFPNLQRIHVICCLLTAKFAHKFLHIPCVQLWLLPGHEVPTTRKLGKVHQVDLAGGPFPRQGRIVRTVCNGCRNR